MISILHEMRYPVTREPISFNEQLTILYEALDAASDPHIDAQCERLREFIKTETCGAQKIGLNTAREILAAIGELMVEKDL